MPNIIQVRRTLLKAPAVIIPAGLGLQTALGSFWSLNNTLADSTGNVTDLTNNNAATFVSTPGSGFNAVAQVANFVNSSSQYLSHANATGLNIVGVDFSLQAWVYPTGNSQTVLSKYSGGFGNVEFLLTYNFGTGPSNPFAATVGNYSAITTSNRTASAWHHCVLTFNFTTKATILYVDDGVAASSTGSGTGPGGTSQFNIGANGSPGSYFSGNIALVGIWRNRVLSAGDVTALYNGGAGLSYAGMA